MSEPLLEIDDLRLRLGAGRGAAEVLRGVSIAVGRGEKLALVGESGSGKTVTALSILRLLEPGLAEYPSGSVRFEGRNLLTLPEPELRRVRGRDIAMIFQEPMTSLNPVATIGEQLMEPLRLHQGLDRAAARQRVLELLARTGLDEPERRFAAYPHMLSGGQRQRAMIAMALAGMPKLLIADEPTTALDVTIQAQILALLEDLQRELGMAVLLITHNLNLVRRFADRVAVMQDGRLVEQGEVTQVLAAPRHAYTRMLIDSRPVRQLEAGEAERVRAAPRLVEAAGVSCSFPAGGRGWRRAPEPVSAVDEVAIRVHAGETLGIVGESGSGKSTLGYCLLRLQACRGEIRFEGRRLDNLRQSQLRPLRRDFQIVFQDPYSSLSPRLTVEQIVGEGLTLHQPQLDRAARRARIEQTLAEVGLGRDMLARYPHEFSGGQRQRIAIARVLVLEPKLVLLDEPTSALDVSVQKQVLELLGALQRRHGMSYIFISHDLAVIRAMAHRVVVMRQGRVVEEGETDSLFAAPVHPYTQQLLRASLLTSGE